ncbi:N-acetylmuramoyl-L-alanine amidase [Pseudoneobacillus sp. C159]
MVRKLKIITAALCCLLIFSPISEIWAKANTETSNSVPIQEGKTNICPESEPVSKENSETLPTHSTSTTGAPTETNPGAPSDSEPIEPIMPVEPVPGTQKECEQEMGILSGITNMTSPFQDVQQNYWAYENILHLSNLKVINGYENQDGMFSFRPEEKVTRAQAAKMMIEAIGEKQATVETQLFSDVSIDHWAAGYIQRAYELGIIKGYEDGRFGPNDTLKRSQMAKIIVEAFSFEYNGYSPSTPVFFDVTEKYWAYSYIERMHYNGITNGSNYRFLAESFITRAQFSAFLSRAIDPKYRLKVTGPISSQGKVISKTALNIRSAESASSTILGQLKPGTMVTIVGINGYWAKVNHDGITGYVHKSYLKLYSADSNFPLKGRIIVVDPGHGLKDPGTHYDGYQEKDIVLSVGKKVRDKLIAAGAQVVMTRDSDTFLELSERVQKAKDVYAELFVSIHVNSVQNNTTVNGTETYFNTSTNMNGPESRMLAYEIQQEIVKQAGMYNRGIKDSGFYVIKNNSVPAVLVEMGFLPNKSDREKMISESYQNIFAEAIYQGIKNYYLK